MFEVKANAYLYPSSKKPETFSLCEKGGKATWIKDATVAKAKKAHPLTFDTWVAARNFVKEIAEKEAEIFNDGADTGVSFGVVYNESSTCSDETKPVASLLYYYNEPEDCTGNTETVTQYFVKERKE